MELNLDKFRINNFDLIRLFAALQVVFHHSMRHLGIDDNGWFLVNLMRLLPGVPLFFFISGFLISKSFQNNPNIQEYAANRIFRIYPALIVCTTLSLLSVFFVGYLSTIQINPAEFIGWIIGQVTFFQFYNPEFMRGFGTGVLNGSLWTITVELQFYIIIPILFLLLRTFNISLNKALVVLIIFFAVINRVFYSYQSIYGDLVLFKLSQVSFAPWLFMFLIGALFQNNFDTVHKYLAGKAWLTLPLYLIIAYLSVYQLDVDTSNDINPALYVLLAISAFSAAYSFPKLSNIILRRNDISYGVYIYHIPIINIMIYFGWTGGILNLSFVIISTITLAMLSWIFIERPSLKLKRHPLSPFLSTSAKNLKK